MDLIFAGIETTSYTLIWSILYMIKYPAVQKKVYQDILKTIGHSRPVRMADKPTMPYIEAVIHEILRITCIGKILERKPKKFKF